MIIAIDFDGTCVSNKFPKVGNDIGATNVLKKLVDKGHNLILYTMRANKNEAYKLPNGNTWYCNPLQDAIKWFKDNNIPLYAVNENPAQKLTTDSNKVFAHLYIDDKNLGIPLIYENRIPYVNWNMVEKELIKHDIL